MKQKILGNLKKGLLFIVSGPAGSGKTTLVRMLTKEFDAVVESVSYTTRSLRKGEKKGRDYFFISEQEFKEKLNNNEFLEFAKVFGYYYGTSKKIVNETLKKGKHVVLVIDVQGALKLKNKVDATYIFVSPPTVGELKKRMVKRCSDSLETIKKRLNSAKEEMEYIKYYDYNVLNKDLKIAYKILKSIFIAQEYKIK